MLISFAECVRVTGGQPFRGVLHIGAHFGEEGPAYHSNGVKTIYWFDGNKENIKRLFLATRMLQLHQQYFCETFSDQDNEKVQVPYQPDGAPTEVMDVVTSRFDTFYRRNIVKVELENVDFVRLNVQALTLKTLQGFGDLFQSYKNIRAVYLETSTEQTLQAIQEHMGKNGFVSSCFLESPTSSSVATLFTR